MTHPTIITAALTGVLATRRQSPAIPYTAEEIAEEARRSADEGAAIVHIHARNPDGSPAWDVESFRQIDEQVRRRCPDLIINYSTGGVGFEREQRIAHISQLRPDMAALNMGSMNYAIYSEKQKTFYHDHVFANPFGDIRFFLERMNEVGTRPELECFDTGHINNAHPLIDLGLLRPPYQFSLIMGVLGGIPATTKHLVHQVDALPAGASWQVVAIGARHWPMIAAAISMGGHIRVGLEDNLYLAPGVLAQSNGALVAKAAALVQMLGGAVASVAEARAYLALPQVAG